MENAVTSAANIPPTQDYLELNELTKYFNHTNSYVKFLYLSYCNCKYK